MAQRLALRGLGGAQSQGSSLAKSANLSRNVVSIQERRLAASIPRPWHPRPRRPRSRAIATTVSALPLSTSSRADADDNTFRSRASSTESGGKPDGDPNSSATVSGVDIERENRQGNSEANTGDDDKDQTKEREESRPEANNENGGLSDLIGLPRDAKQRAEVEFGTFHEFTAVTKTGGKLFEASRELIPVEDAVHFPSLEASSLTGKDVKFPERLKDRVTLVGLFHRQFGYSMLPSWTEPFEKAFGTREAGSSRITIPSALHISLLESWALRLLKPVLIHTMGKGLAPEKKSGFFYRFGATEELRKSLAIQNRLTLYVLLVDQDGKVRWRGVGKSTPDEVDSLVRCARQLAASSSGNSVGRSGDNDSRKGRPARRDSRTPKR